jgi:hypothetical protein
MLNNKTILILSPQAWGQMFISKHHYAIELAKRGNKVYYLNPPGEAHVDNKPVSITSLSFAAGLHLVTHKLYFPYNLKFHAPKLFHWLMKRQIKKIQKAIGSTIDIVWSFDLNNMYQLDEIGKQSIKIFHPVDEPLNETAILAGNGADIVFSVTREILQKYTHLKRPMHFINHGVADNFLASKGISNEAQSPIHVGFSGNLIRKDIDREILLKIVQENPDIIFEFWGSYSSKDSNIGGTSDDKTTNFISALRVLSNVILHGPVASNILAKAIHNMDAFLICYDVKKDQSKGTNYHKIMEYLSTGKVIVSNNVTTYNDQPQLLRMVRSRETNAELPALFTDTVKDLQQFNSAELQHQRIQFAINNTYSKQLDRISEILEEQFASVSFKTSGKSYSSK